jgi:outer membrane protein assembly factor BamB
MQPRNESKCIDKENSGMWTRRKPTPSKLALGLLCATATALSASAENWPQYRGPDRSGIVTEKNLAQTWPEKGPKELWRKPTGIGFASPIGVGGKVYDFYLGEGNTTDILEAFDANTGESIWKQSVPSKYVPPFPGTRCTPVIDGDRIYTYGADAHLIARNLADGKELWTVDVIAESGSVLRAAGDNWGNSSTPVIDGDFIYVQARENGNAAVCINKNDGKVIWKSEAKDGGYASPVMADVGGKKLLLCFASQHLIAMDPATGKTLWTLAAEFETQYRINATLPIVHDGKVFLSCAYNNHRCGLYDLTKITADGPEKVWDGKQITARFQAPILDDGYLYANSEGTLTCVRWNDGKVMWTSPRSDKLLSYGGPILRFGGDKLICINSENGELSLIKATPEGMEKLSVLKRFVQGNQIWATPLIFNQKLYIQSKDELIAYDIGMR